MKNTLSRCSNFFLYYGRHNVNFARIFQVPKTVDLGTIPVSSHSLRNQHIRMASFPPLTSLMADNTSLGMNCSDILVKSNPGEMVRELGPKILILYGYAILVVLITFILQFKYGTN